MRGIVCAAAVTVLLPAVAAAQNTQELIDGSSAAQEMRNLLEETPASHVMLHEEMVLTLEFDEFGARNSSSHLATEFERNH